MANLNLESSNSKLLADMSASDIGEALSSSIEYLSDSHKQAYVDRIVEKNINGRVLEHCDLGELKSELGVMSFGDWHLFRAWILAKRVQMQNHYFKLSSVVPAASIPSKTVEFVLTPSFDERLKEENDEAKKKEESSSKDAMKADDLLVVKLSGRLINAETASLRSDGGEPDGSGVKKSSKSSSRFKVSSSKLSKFGNYSSILYQDFYY
jgi:hypothetical protein